MSNPCGLTAEHANRLHRLYRCGCGVVYQDGDSTGPVFDHLLDLAESALASIEVAP